MTGAAQPRVRDAWSRTRRFHGTTQQTEGNLMSPGIADYAILIVARNHRQRLAEAVRAPRIREHDAASNASHSSNRPLARAWKGISASALPGAVGQLASFPQRSEARQGWQFDGLQAEFVAGSTGDRGSGGLGAAAQPPIRLGSQRSLAGVRDEPERCSTAWLSR